MEPPSDDITHDDTAQEDLTQEADSGPQRRCLVTRASFPRETMLRFVAGPEQILVFDIAATLPGRGMWLSAGGDVVQSAVKRGVFPRAAKMPLKLPADLQNVVINGLRRRVVDLLGLARRGGAAISGFEKAREWLASGRAGLVVQAVDGSEAERQRFIGNRTVPVITPLDTATLGRIFGRDEAVHVVVAPGRLARMIETDATRLIRVADATKH